MGAERALDELNYSTIEGRCCRIMWSHDDPEVPRVGPGNIVIKNLDFNIDNHALHDTFKLFGEILTCKVSLSGEGMSKGYGFVHFAKESSAEQAIKSVNGLQIGQRKVSIEKYSNETNSWAHALPQP